MCRLTVHKIIPLLCNFHLSAVQTCLWCEKFQLHFDRWQDFSEEERQDSHSSLARNGNSCLPSGTLCYRFGLLPGERPEFSTMWGRPTEETSLISSEESLTFSILEDTWSVWGSHQVYLFSLQYRSMYTSPADRCNGENCSSPKVHITSEEDKIARKNDDAQERNGSWLVDGNSLKLRRYHHGPNSQWQALTGNKCLLSKEANIAILTCKAINILGRLWRIIFIF